MGKCHIMKLMRHPSRAIRGFVPTLLAIAILSLALPADAAAAAWRSMPLEGGAVVGIEASRDAQPVVWAVTPIAGVFRSVDDGHSWLPVRTVPSPRAILAGVDPQDGDRVFAMFLDPRTYDYTQLGLFFTTDGGATWTRSRRGLGTTPFVYQVAFDPRDDATVYAATSNGLHRSTDGGRSWTRLWQNEGVFAVGVVPDDPRILLISTLHQAYRSTDGGATFTQVLESGLYSLAFDPNDPSQVYGTEGLIFHSSDRGLTWRQIGRSFDFGITSVTVGEDGTLYAGSPYGVLRSSNSGTTFTPAASADTRYPDDGIGDVAALPNGDVLAAGARGVWRLAAGQNGWKPTSQGIRALDVAGLAVTPGGRLLASVPLNGVFRSDNGGAGFQSGARGLRDPYGVPGLRLVPAPSNPRVVYGGDHGKLFRSDDAGVSWRPLALSNPAPLVTVLAVHPTNPDVVYAGGEEENPRGDYGKCHAYRSRDGGASWTCLEGGELYTLNALAVDPQRPQRLFALDFIRLLVSDDEGATWRVAGEGLPTEGGGYASALAIDAEGRLFVGTGDGRVLRSTDHGATFSQVGRDLPHGFILGLILDPLRPGTLYALFYQQGIFRSRDGGRHWEPLGTGLPTGQFLGVAALDARRGLLFAGTFGRGLYRIDVR
jgi:photosystem II stability/assembly factor-like uncharacterized protein